VILVRKRLSLVGDVVGIKATDQDARRDWSKLINEESRRPAALPNHTRSA
jgi:hypothetical protein